jgi:hypothetical protein
MAKGSRAMVLVVLVLAGFGASAASQTPRQYEAFVRAEINKCVEDAVRLDKQSGSRNQPTRAEHTASCREMMLQIHDLYPMPEEKKKSR